MILRTLVCIPTYNNPGTIAQVADDALQMTSLAVLIVDDGSAQPVRDLLATSACVEALASGRLQVVRLPENRGKGIALQTAIKWAVERGYTHLLAVDGDGQHLLSEAGKILEAGRQRPFDLIIGKRRFSGDNIPGASVFGRKFSNFWVGYQTGQIIEDSQSGYRLYPLFHLQNWRFFTRRYDFEIEVLIRMLWNGIGVHEVEMDVYYPPADERVSHFDKLWDNVRISLLNTLLVVLSLLRQNLTPGKAGSAVGLGVFIGATPFYGFHTAIAAAAAFGFRLNALLVFLGSNISFPPLALILVPAEIAVGKFMLKDWPSLVQWLAGSLIVGTVLGFTIGAAVWAVTSRLQKSKTRGANWTGKTRGGRFGNGFLRQVLRFCGLRTGYFFLLFIIPYFYLFAPRARRALLEYWSILRPEAGFFRRRWLVMRHLYRFGQVLLDRGFQAFSSSARFHVNSQGTEHILTPVREKRPLILATTHAGGWDIAAALLSTNGLWGRFHVVQYQPNGLSFDKATKGREKAQHINSLALNQDPVMQVKLKVDAAEPVGLMADRAGGTQYELVPFFGRLAPFDARPFRIAAVCKCPLLATFGFKGEGDRYDLYAYEPRLYAYDPARPRDEQVREWVAEYARTVEGMIRRYPDQWFNFFPFFSSRPKSPPGVQAGPERNSLLEEWRKPTTPAAASAPAPKPSDAGQSPL